MDVERNRCCETLLYTAAMELEGLSTSLRLLRADGRLDADSIAEVFRGIAVIERDLADALTCAAEDLAWLHRMAAACVTPGPVVTP